MDLLLLTVLAHFSLCYGLPSCNLPCGSDMILTPSEQSLKAKGLTPRTGVIDTRLRWPNLVVPYKISGDFTSGEKDFIINSIAEIQSKTCLQLVTRTNESDYVYVTVNISFIFKKHFISIICIFRVKILDAGQMSDVWEVDRN